MSVQAIDKRTEAEAALAGAFDLAKDKSGGALRRAAWEDFARKGLPTRRVEAWHYTDLRAALRSMAPIGVEQKIAAPFESASDRVKIVVADGEFRPDLSDLSALPAGVEAFSLTEALSNDELASLLAPEGPASADAVVALNAALMQDGVVLRIAPGAAVDNVKD